MGELFQKFHLIALPLLATYLCAVNATVYYQFTIIVAMTNDKIHMHDVQIVRVVMEFEEKRVGGDSLSSQ